MQRLIVEGSMLRRESGEPFFWLADTAWELFHRYTPADAVRYLETRTAQGFTVVQAVLLAEQDGLRVPDRLDHLPFRSLVTLEPEEAYWAHIDQIVAQANALGLVMALLPTWGDKVTPMWGKGPKIFNPANARDYGRWVGARYRDADVVWVIGGDRPVNTDEDLAVWRAMAEGIRESVGDAHLFTFHPCGGQSSATYVHDEPWLDFNMLQSGHRGRDNPNGEMIRHDLEIMPHKPVLDGEPNYEDHPVMAALDGLYVKSGEYFGAFDVRKSFYRSVFAGACGFTYGCHAVWQGWDPAFCEPINAPLKPAMASLELEGACQLRYGRTLIEKLLACGGVRANDGLLLESALPLARRMAACSFAGGFAVYTPMRQDIALRRHAFGFAWAEGCGRWFDPRTGLAQSATLRQADAACVHYVPPADGDWVLVLAASAALFVV